MDGFLLRLGHSDLWLAPVPSYLLSLLLSCIR